MRVVGIAEAQHVAQRRSASNQWSASVGRLTCARTPPAFPSQSMAARCARDVGHRLATKRSPEVAQEDQEEGGADRRMRAVSGSPAGRVHQARWSRPLVAPTPPACARLRRTGGCLRSAFRPPSRPRCASSGRSSRRGESSVRRSPCAASSVSRGVSSPGVFCSSSSRSGLIVSRSQPASRRSVRLLRKLAPITCVL